MSAVEITEAFLAKIAGWEAVKQARVLLERGAVLSSNWTPPILKGAVQEGAMSYRAGLAVKDAIDVENMCGCRASRQWGTICAHSVAVGLHHLRRNAIETRRLDSKPAAGGAGSDQAGRAVPVSQAASIRKANKRAWPARPGEKGEPAELFVIFPPNLAQATAKGKIMVCFEVKTSRGRAPLNTLPADAPFEFSAQDAAVLERIIELAEGEAPSMLLLTGEQLGRVLERLTEHPRVSLGRSQPVEVLGNPWPIPLEASLQPTGEIRLTMRPQFESVALIPGESVWVFHNASFQPAGLPKGCLDVIKGPMQLSRSQAPVFLSRDYPVLQATADLKSNFRLEDFVLEPRPPRFLLNLAGGLAVLQARLQCAYGERILTLGAASKEESLWMADPKSATTYSTRDLGAEQAALGVLLKAGFTGPDEQGDYHLRGQDAVLRFFARDYPRLQKQWHVTLEERLERSATNNLERIEPRFEITPSGERWFDLDVSFSSGGGERFSAADIQRLVLSGQSHARLKNGKFALIDTGAVEELQEVLLDCSPRQQDGRYRIQDCQAGFLGASLQQHGNWQVAAPADWRTKVFQQSGEAKLEAPPLGDLETVLRPYQKHGVAWLNFLRQNRFGGILADEMGLGKTVQTLAFLQAMTERRDAEARKPSLIVCPTSLVFNWVAEARTFTPRLRVLALQGGQRRALFQEIEQSDLVITSYALIRRDAEVYRSMEFDTVVLDEAQHIKNRQTQNAQAVKGVRAGHRFVLTGTPLENSVLDLWSIFDFLMPGYLGAAKDFRERYEMPIARDKDPEAQARLARRVRPFLLRRLKSDVARDLPAKIEQVSFCDLTEEQQAVYQQVLDLSRKELLEAAGAQGVQKSRMVALNALLRLRQICCDLRLLNLENAKEANSSGKMELFSELLEEALDGGHRVLVFSQFVSMLALIRTKLETEGIAFSYLDGATTNRAQVVEQFQKKTEIPVFLISLKAGGVGLNLTGADTVIHFDPWWNPAVEDQATDRAHRIGQTRVVTSYKLITRGTVEEKILNLQRRKREVIQGMLAGEEEFAGSLTWEELQDLFA